MKFGVQPTTTFQVILEWIASIFSIAYFVSPLIEIIRLYKGTVDRKTISMFLLLSILLNCLFWGIFAVLQEDIWVSMILTNSIGLAINIALMFTYLYLFLDYAIKPFLGYGLFVVNLLVEVGYLMFVLINNGKINDLDYVGKIAMCFNILMYASPITNIYKMYRASSYDYLPIYTNLIGFVTCALWIWYGILTKNSATWISNTGSIAVVTLQILFWGYYYWKHPRNGREPLAVESLEIDPEIKEDQ